MTHCKQCGCRVTTMQEEREDDARRKALEENKKELEEELARQPLEGDPVKIKICL